MQALDVAQAVFQNLRSPSQQKLAWQTALRAMSDCQKRLLREAQLSDRGWLETYEDITPVALDEPVSILGFSIPTRVEYRIAGPMATDDDWMPVAIVNHDGFSDVTHEAVAFYGTPLRIQYGLPESELDGRQYRIWYETSPVALTELSQNLEIMDLFSDLLTDETTIYCIPLVNDDSPEWVNWVRLQVQISSSRVIESKKQWIKWLNLTRENGVIYGDGFQPSAYSEEAAYIGADGLIRAN